MSQGTKYTVKNSLLASVARKVFTNTTWQVTADMIQTAMNDIIESLWGLVTDVNYFSLEGTVVSGLQADIGLNVVVVQNPNAVEHIQVGDYINGEFSVFPNGTTVLAKELDGETTVLTVSAPAEASYTGKFYVGPIMQYVYPATIGAKEYDIKQVPDNTDVLQLTINDPLSVNLPLNVRAVTKVTTPANGSRLKYMPKSVAFWQGTGSTIGRFSSYLYSHFPYAQASSGGARYGECVYECMWWNDVWYINGN